MLTNAQKAARVGKITSSVAAACLGLDRRMSQIEAWLRIRGEDDSAPANVKAIDRGNRLEALILQYPADELGLVYRPAPFRSIAPWAGDSTDALYYATPEAPTPVAIGEGKSASMGIGREYGAEGTDEIPQHTLIQAHWHLIHWPEVDRCLVPVLVGGYRFEFRLYEVKRDVELESQILADLEAWHTRHIVGDTMPPVSSRDTDWLSARYPLDTQGALAETPEIAEAARAAMLAASEKRAAEDRETEARNRLRAALGAHSSVSAPWGSVTWRARSPSAVTNWRAVAEAAGASAELIAQHTETKPGPRVLRVTPSAETKAALGL